MSEHITLPDDWRKQIKDVCRAGPTAIEVPSWLFGLIESWESPAAEAEVVTLCGSMRFFGDMLKVASEETSAGRVVLAPFTVVAPEEQGSNHKAMLDELHRRKIDLSSSIIVVTRDGYIGESTRGEIAYAEQTGKTVRYIDVPSEPASDLQRDSDAPSGLVETPDDLDLTAGDIGRMLDAGQPVEIVGPPLPGGAEIVTPVPTMSAGVTKLALPKLAEQIPVPSSVVGDTPLDPVQELLASRTRPADVKQTTESFTSPAKNASPRAWTEHDTKPADHPDVRDGKGRVWRWDSTTDTWRHADRSVPEWEELFWITATLTTAPLTEVLPPADETETGQ